MEKVRENTFCEFTALQKLRVNACGKLAFIAVRPDEQKNTYIRELCLYKNGIIRRNIASFIVLRDFVWMSETVLLINALCDRKYAGYAADDVPISVLYTLDIRTGELREYAKLPYKIAAFKTIGDGRCIMSVQVEPEAQALYAQCGQNIEAYADAYRQAKKCFTATEIPFCMEGEGFTGNARTVLCICQNGVLRELTTHKETVCGFDIFEDETLLFIVKEFDSIRRDESNIRKYNLKTGEMTIWKAQAPKIYANIKAISHSKYIAACTDGKLHGIYQDFSIEVCDTAEKTTDIFNADAGLSLFCSVNTDIHISSGHFIEICTDADGFYFVATVHDSSHIFRADYKTKEIAQVTHKPGLVKEAVLFGNKLYFIGARGVSGFELYHLDAATGKEKQLTDFNGRNDELFWAARPQEVSFHNKDGYEIFGWIMKPMNFTPGKRYPAVLSIHGGPNTAYGPNYIHELQFLASNGYGVFYCNPRGSVGRGGLFMDIRDKYFDADVSDLLEFTDFVVSSNNWIDTEKLGVMGGSYGGIMTAWLAGHNTRFAAAVTERTATNFISYFGTSEIGSQWMLDTLFTTPWQDIQKYWDYSPLKYAPLVNLPVLVIQSYLDYTCPHGSALEFFNALKFFQKEAKLVLFKEENHALKLSGAPRARIRRLKETIEWFDTYLK